MHFLLIGGDIEVRNKILNYLESLTGVLTAQSDKLNN